MLRKIPGYLVVMMVMSFDHARQRFNMDVIFRQTLKSRHAPLTAPLTHRFFSAWTEDRPPSKYKQLLFKMNGAVPEGALCAVMGPRGCGKRDVCRCLHPLDVNASLFRSWSG